MEFIELTCVKKISKMQPRFHFYKSCISPEFFPCEYQQDKKQLMLCREIYWKGQQFMICLSYESLCLNICSFNVRQWNYKTLIGM